MKRIIILILLTVSLVVSAQRMELYMYNSYKYIALYAYGLQRDVVRTNSEMRTAQFNGDGTGVLKRHHTTKGFDERIGDEGYNCNDKISFAFMVAPYNVDKDGHHTSTEKLTWAEASGWDSSLNSDGGNYNTETGVGNGESIIASSPTGCSAYRGPNGTDKAGEWRLPTQREIQVMFTVIEQSLDYIAADDVEHEIIEGVYWSATEFYDSGTKAWSISSITGQPLYEPKTETRMVRCVKDIYEPINN